jgi:hypothetical protein
MIIDIVYRLLFGYSNSTFIFVECSPRAHRKLCDDLPGQYTCHVMSHDDLYFP